jgi:hypothetical protein
LLLQCFEWSFQCFFWQFLEQYFTFLHTLQFKRFVLTLHDVNAHLSILEEKVIGVSLIIIFSLFL